jgi:short subunit dehydrogenase-like uncharacterized protein
LGFPYGQDFAYDEMLILPGPPKPGSRGSAGFDLGGSAPPLPGEGPNAEERAAGNYDLLFVAEADDGRLLHVAVKGDMDPGYGSTSKILAEAALALAQDVPHSMTSGGAWTPAAAMAEALLARLPNKAGLTFTLED